MFTVYLAMTTEILGRFHTMEQAERFVNEYIKLYRHPPLINVGFAETPRMRRKP